MPTRPAPAECGGCGALRRRRKATRPQRLARSLSLSPIAAHSASCWWASRPPLIVLVPKPLSFVLLVRVYSRFAYVREQASRDGFACLIRDKRSRRRLDSFKRADVRKSHSWKPQEAFLSPVAFVPYRCHPLFPIAQPPHPVSVADFTPKSDGCCLWPDTDSEFLPCLSLIPSRHPTRALRPSSPWLLGLLGHSAHSAQNTRSAHGAFGESRASP